MKTIFLFLLLFSALKAGAQKITLEQCIDSALVNYPLSRQQEIYDQILQTELKRLSNTNLPQVNLSAKATLQNQVISFPANMPAVITFPELSKDQYRATLEISQSIYKGGVTPAQKELSRASNAVDSAGTEVELNGLKRTVISIYYQSLLSKEFLSVSKTYRKTLAAKLGEMEAQIKEGALLPSAADVVKAEMLTVEQRITQLEMNIASLKLQMEKITGMHIGSLDDYVLPAPRVSYSAQQQRPEYKFLELSEKKLDALSSVYSSRTRPVVFAFSSLGVGRPGFDYLSNDFAPLAMVGLGLNWNLWNWGDTKKQKSILELKKSLIENRKKSFVTDLNIKLINLQSEIESEKKMLEKAEEIARLRKSVSQTTEKQLKDGVVTASRYIDELQKYEKARLEVQIHKVKLSIAQTNYLYALGKL